MKPFQHVIWAAALLSACGGNPFTDGDTTGAPDGTTGTGNSAKSTITRTEATGTGADAGNGFATGISLVDPDPESEGDEVFVVDNLAFDGKNVYQRGTTVPGLGAEVDGRYPFQVYEGDLTVADSTTGTEIPQFEYRAIYGASTSGKTNFAIVRTGSYIGYGFGGFVFNRTGKVTLPENAQAHYSGEYAGLRDFDGAGGLEYVYGNMTMDIDFEDFNAGAAIKGEVTDRVILDINGEPITSAVLAALNASLDPLDTPLEVLPVLTFEVGPGVLKSSGEADGSISSCYNTVTEGCKAFEEGKFYAVISDTATGAAQEVVGIIRVTSEQIDAAGEQTGVTVRETGGFILYNQ